MASQWSFWNVEMSRCKIAHILVYHENVSQLLLETHNFWKQCLLFFPVWDNSCLSTSSAWECHFLETFLISGYSWPKMIPVWNLGDGSETVGIFLHKFSWLARGTDSHSRVGTFQFVFSLSWFPARLPDCWPCWLIATSVLSSVSCLGTQKSKSFP